MLTPSFCLEFPYNPTVLLIPLVCGGKWHTQPIMFAAILICGLAVILIILLDLFSTHQIIISGEKNLWKFHPLYQSRNPLYQSITIPPTIAHQIKSRTISVYIPPESIDISRSIEAASCWRTWPPRRHDFGCPWSTWWWKAGSGSMELAKNSWISPGKMRISWWIQWDFMMLTGKISFWWLRFAHLRQLIWSYLYQSISRCIRN